ncbi:glycosyl transferase family 1 [Roseovarius halotolerans]|uniref:Glycosyl transferases group 1 n=2 Tax=Roseovarius halotolerans TaxID=505353 RepID=A0A1X6Z2F2_9RHOB|nr:glycosyl transferase family 1 [Roseovarius halotolerans]SLN38510.1 hypothetical protein ROH8110_02029 [Roseovarius halotolerans]
MERIVRKPNLARWRAAYQSARCAAREERSVLVSHLPRMSAATNLFRKRFCPQVPQIAFAFNFTDMPVKMDFRRLRSMLAGIDEFIVFSQYERSLYSEYFGFQPERFRFLHWAMEAPQPGPENPVSGPDSYLCSIGGEGRDYRLLAEAMRALPDVAMVVVARPHSIRGINFPQNVKVFTNLPARQTWRIVQDSAGVVIPLRSDKTTCGHITIVGSMLLGRAMVITDSLGVSDYVEDGVNAHLVPAGDTAAMIAAVQGLSHNSAAMRDLGARASARAREKHALSGWVSYFTEKSAEYEARLP